MKHIIILTLTVIFMGSCTEEPIEIPVEDTFYTLTDNLIEECCQCLNWHGYKVSTKQYSHTYQNAISIVNYYIDIMEENNIPFDDTVGEGDTYYMWYLLKEKYSHLN